MNGVGFAAGAVRGMRPRPELGEEALRSVLARQPAKLGHGCPLGFGEGYPKVPFLDVKGSYVIWGAGTQGRSPEAPLDGAKAGVNVVATADMPLDKLLMAYSEKLGKTCATLRTDRNRDLGF
eukprot:gene12889-biopygen38218